MQVQYLIARENISHPGFLLGWKGTVGGKVMLVEEGGIEQWKVSYLLKIYNKELERILTYQGTYLVM